MIAVVYDNYGPADVLRLTEVDRPAAGDDEVLVKVHAATVTSGDTRIRGFDVPAGQWLMARVALGIRGPKHPILGVELAGEITDVGDEVRRFKPGDRVFGEFPLMVSGAHAEYACMAEDWVVATMPSNMSYEEAAGVPFMGISALYFLRQAKIQPGQKVLIIGASGSVGCYAVQLAKYYGAEVTGLCSTQHLDLVQSLGADRVIDYTKEDYAHNGERYDVIFDAVDKAPFSRCKDSLKDDGVYVTVGGGISQLLQMKWTALRKGKRVIAGTAEGTVEDLIFLRDLIESGQLKSVVDRCYPLAQITEAHRYVETGHKAGNVVIVMDGNSGEDALEEHAD